ncbi:MAG: TPM domain-containing protein [Flavobacterium sp.]
MIQLVFRIVKFLLIVSLLLLHQLGFGQFTIPPKPDFQTSVYDYAKLLNANEKSALENKLIKYSDSTTTQIVVITIEELKNEDIGLLTPKWLTEWGIGQAKEDNGILILLSKNDRKIWISPGYGVEDRLIASINGEIIDNIIIPEFKAGSYYNGLDKGSDAIFEVLKGKYKGYRIQDSNDDSIFPILLFIIIFVVIMIIATKNKGGGNSGNSSGGPSLLDIIILSNMGRSSGGGFGGSSGGGFGGGGFGGGFGGGGASGGGAGGSW